MPIKITLTEAPEQIDAVLKIRHKVFSEEEQKIPASPDGRILDRFDAYPSTKNLAVLVENEVVGGMRLTLDSKMGLPADEYYDFRSQLPSDYQLMSCGMYCITKPFRSPRIALGLILMASYFAVAHKVSHVIAPVNPDIAKLLKRVGFETLGEEMLEPHTGLTILPMLLDMNNLNDFFFNFTESNRLNNFINSYECVFYRKDEYIIRAGEQADTAYVIIEGEVAVQLPDANESVHIMKQGEVFGELALLTDGVRSADVIAITDIRVMALEKTVFTQHLLHHPEQAMLMLKNIANRLATKTY